MNIGTLAKRSGVSAKMVRYYEEIGLIPKANRGPSGYRVYSDTDVHRLGFIRSARDLGFSIESIRNLLALWQDPSRHSADVKDIALEQVGLLQRKVSELTAMINALQILAERCSGDERPDCPILLDLEAGDSTTARASVNRFGLVTRE